MTIIEVPAGFRWEIKKSMSHEKHDGPCTMKLNGNMRRAYECEILTNRYYLVYQHEVSSQHYLRTDEKKSPGKHWWSRKIVTKVRVYSDMDLTWVNVTGTRLPLMFDESDIRNAAWGILYDLAVKENINALDRFVGVYPPKELS